MLNNFNAYRMNNLIIAFVNHKGGVGKTTSTATLGAAFALKGKKVLTIDLDAQQNLTFALGYHGSEDDPSIYEALVGGGELPAVSIRENLDLAPASLSLARAEVDLSHKMMRESVLKNLLAGVRNKYDVILIDCPPSLGIVTTNALVAADKLYIPLTAEVLPLKGLKMIDDVFKEVKKLVNSRLEIGGVFFTRFNHRKVNREVEKLVREFYGDKVLRTKIRENITLAEMPLSGQTVFEYDPNCNGAKDYETLADEILSLEFNS